MVMVRYADDFVIGFEHRKVAERFLEQLRERLRGVRAGTASGKDAPDTVRAVCPSIDSGMGKGSRKPLTFWVSRTPAEPYTRRASVTVLRKTIGKRMAAKLKAIKAGTAQTDARAYQGHRRLATRRSARLLQLFRRAGELSPVAVVRHDVIRSWWQAVRRRGQRPCVVQCLTGSSLSISRLPRFCILIHWSGFAPHIRDKNRVR